VPTQDQFDAYYRKNRLPHWLDEKRIAEVATRRGITVEALEQEILEHDLNEELGGLAIEWGIERLELQARLPEAIRKLEADGYKVEKGNPYHYAEHSAGFVPVCKVVAPGAIEPEYCLPFDLVKFALLGARAMNNDDSPVVVDRAKWQAHLAKQFVEGCLKTQGDELLERAENTIRELKKNSLRAARDNYRDATNREKA
jgi:hypothetical protein